MKKLLFIILGIALTGSQYSCRKTLDVNKNPNDPADVTVMDLLPAAQVSLAHQYGNYYQITGGLWAQYWTQNASSSQYRSYEQYNPDPSDGNRPWQELYAGVLTDLDQIVKKAGTAENTRNYTAIAKILQGFTYQLLTDAYGDIPFSEALLGQSTNGQNGITSPKYDRQQDVYAGIIKLVKEGRDLIDEGALAPGNDDLLLHGDMATWGQFANTLLLRMYLRMVYVNPGAAMAGISEVSADPYGFLQTTVQMNYANSAGNYNPLYSEIVGLSFTTNLVASATSVNALVSRNYDPRVEVFYTGLTALEQGYYSTPSPTTYSKPSGLVGGDPADPSSAEAPVKFISSYESYFLQAEAAARMGDVNTAREAYETAVRTNFEEYGLSEYGLTDTTGPYVDSLLERYAVYPTGGSTEDQIRMIITEKWFAMNGTQNFEAWTEWRRTGYPTFFTVSRNSRVGNQFPARLPYPENESTRNLNFPGQRPVTEKLWWDVN